VSLLAVSVLECAMLAMSTLRPARRWLVILWMSAACGGGEKGAVDGGADAADAPELIELVAGTAHTCALWSHGKVQCWGDVDSEVLTPPPGESFRQIHARWSHTCGVTSSGDVICWGTSTRTLEPPAGSYLQVSSSREIDCALRADGRAECWGTDDAGSGTPPTGEYTQVAAAWSHGCAIRAGDGEVSCWGSDPGTAPTGPFSALRAGSFSTCALRHPEQTAACWGEETFVGNPPSDRLSTIAAGVHFSCGIRASDQSIVCWGESTREVVTTAPEGPFRRVACGVTRMRARPGRSSGLLGRGQRENPNATRTHALDNRLWGI